MSTLEDLTGQKYNRWTVIKQVQNKNGRRVWLCKCECGTEKELSGHSLTKKKGSKSCGCIRKEYLASQALDLTNQKFGMLTALKIASREKKVKWLCMCECGKESIVSTGSLRNGHTISCGCYKNVTNRQTATKLLSKNPKLTSAKAVYTSGYNDGDISFDVFLKISQLPCHYCSLEADKSNIYNRYKRSKRKFKLTLNNISDGDFYYNGLDRIDSSKLHNLDNVVPCCKYCNRAKMDRDYDEFVAWIKRASENLIQKEKDSR